MIAMTDLVPLFKCTPKGGEGGPPGHGLLGADPAAAGDDLTPRLDEHCRTDNFFGSLSR